MDLAQRAETEHLEAAGVGEKRMRPAYETVQALMRGDDVESRPQPQMVGVAEDDLRAELLELARCHGLDRAVSADRHEDRRLDGAMRERQAPATRGATLRGDRELHRRDCSSAVAHYLPAPAEGSRSISIASP